jgi:methionyl-tRNA formyltransferase
MVEIPEFKGIWAGGNVLLLAKNDSWCHHAVTLSRIAFGDRLIVCQGTTNDPFPAIPPNRWSALISYRSPWIIPEDILSRSEVAINFHPGSRDYPGYGCYSFAIYERAAEYGCVCHHMVSTVDTGPLIEERRFRTIENETVETLKLRTYVVMQALFQDILFQLARGEYLPQPEHGWSRRPFTRRQHQQLATVSAGMSDEEIRLRVRATTYPGEGAMVSLGEIVFRAEVPSRPPIA